MDLRIQRTKAAIRAAFLELRKKKPIEKITVTELSKLAGINKATFYLHYADIYFLSDEIEDEIIEQIISNLNLKERFFTQPQEYASEFTTEIFRAFSENRLLSSVFSGSRYSLFSQKIEQRIKASLYEKYPDINTLDNDIILTFLIQGSFHTIAGFRDEEREAAYNVISGCTSKIIEQMVNNSDK
ncbi:MAG: TetR/AcrR family transcriptional regulator [Oscillospiraceae bacterium]